MRKANAELLMTMNTCWFCTRSCAAVLFAPDDWSSMYETSILRLFTPPPAFSRPTRALQPISESPDVAEATPVFE